MKMIESDLYVSRLWIGSLSILLPLGLSVFHKHFVYFVFLVIIHGYFLI